MRTERIGKAPLDSQTPGSSVRVTTTSVEKTGLQEVTKMPTEFSWIPGPAPPPRLPVIVSCKNLTHAQRPLCLSGLHNIKSCDSPSSQQSRSYRLTHALLGYHILVVLYTFGSYQKGATSKEPLNHGYLKPL